MQTATTEQAQGSGKPTEGQHQTVTVTVSTPDKDEEFTFPKTAKIEEVIATVVNAFGLDPNDVYALALAETPADKLDPKRPLVSYGIETGTHLVLSSKGGGV